jgi:hypothetical protein
MRRTILVSVVILLLLSGCKAFFEAGGQGIEEAGKRVRGLPDQGIPKPKQDSPTLGSKVIARTAVKTAVNEHGERLEDLIQEGPETVEHGGCAILDLAATTKPLFPSHPSFVIDVEDRKDKYYGRIALYKRASVPPPNWEETDEKLKEIADSIYEAQAAASTYDRFGDYYARILHSTHVEIAEGYCKL